MACKSSGGINSDTMNTKSLYCEETTVSSTSGSESFADFLSKITGTTTITAETAIIEKDNVVAPFITATDTLSTNGIFQTLNMILENSTFVSSDPSGINFFPSSGASIFLNNSTTLTGNIYSQGIFRVGIDPNYLFIADPTTNNIYFGVPINLDSIVLPTGRIYSSGNNLNIDNTTASGNIEFNPSGTGRVVIDNLNLSGSDISSPSGINLIPGSGDVNVYQRLSFQSGSSTAHHIINSNYYLDILVSDGLLLQAGSTISLLSNGTIQLDNLNIYKNGTGTNIITDGLLKLESENDNIRLDTPLANSVIIYNSNNAISSSTGAFIVNGGVGIKRKLYIGETLNVSGVTYLLNGTQSTYTGDGSLVVTGGVGIGKNVNIGENLDVTSDLTVNNDTYCKQLLRVEGDEGSSGTNTGSLTVIGGVGISEKLYVGNQIRNVSIIESHSYTEGSIVTDGGVGIADNLYVNGLTSIEDCEIKDTTQSSASNDGALTVSGGVGIQLQLNVGGITRIYSTQNSNNTNNGALIVDGGVGIALDTYIGGELHVTGAVTFQTMVIESNTPSDSTISGALQVVGGVGIGENMHIGGQIYSENDTEPSLADITTGAIYTAGGIGIEKKAYIKDVVYCMKTDPSNDTESGSLVVSGGVGIADNIYIGDTCNILNSDIAFSNTSTGSLIVHGGISTIKNIYIHDDTDYSSIASTGALIINGGVGIGKSLTVHDRVIINKIETSTDVLTGALILSGGIGTSSNIYVGDSSESTSTTSGAIIVEGGIGVQLPSCTNGIHDFSDKNPTSYTTGALIVDGGCGIGKDVYIHENLYVEDSINCTNSITSGTSYTTTLYVDHLEEKTASAGIIFNANTKLQILSITDSGNISSGSVVLEGGMGIKQTLNVKDLNVVSLLSTPELSITGGGGSSSTNSGALTVDGGVGISEKLYVDEIHVVKNPPPANDYIVSTYIENGVTYLQSAIETSGTSSGALVITGGVGVGKTLRAVNIISTNFVETASDRKFKEKINYDDVPSIEFIDKVKPCSYHLINSQFKNYGVIAQDMQEILDEYNMLDTQIVTPHGDGLRVSYMNFISILIKSMQDLHKKINDLSDKLNTIISK
jgi:hypothetical protein